MKPVKHLYDPDLVHRFDFELKKSTHIRMELKERELLNQVKEKLGLTRQDIFECFAKEVITNNPHVIRMLNSYRLKKDEERPKRYSKPIIIHFNLMKETKYEFDTMKPRLKLSLQEIYDCLIENLLYKEPKRLIQILENYRDEQLKSKEKNVFKGADKETIYKLIEKEHPFNEKE